VVLPTPIPGKGVVLTQLSRFWFDRTGHIVPNHLITTDLSELSLDQTARQLVIGRSMIVRKAERIDVECVVRGYLAGSGWTEYVQNGTLAGQPLPAGLRQAERLDAPVFTPALKNDAGHDENVGIADLDAVIGSDLRSRLQTLSLALYGFAAEYAAERGLILADTKFEFGFIDGELTLIDEALTPDSSRFWDAHRYEPGRDQASFDKQFVRDWLTQSGWNREPPGPELPDHIVRGTSERYRAAFARLTGDEIGPLQTADGRSG
jgi:phosphoribosylaminoimidazole-succinocarboxamide synthase